MTSGESVRAFLYLLLLTDAGFIALHVFYTAGFFPDSLFSVSNPGERKALFSMLAIDRDRSYAELFGYIQMAWTVLLLGWLALKHSWKLYAGWVLLFAYFLLDDSMSLHEHLGNTLVQSLALSETAGLRAQDLGEILSVLLIAGVIFPLIGLGYWLEDRSNRGGVHRLMMAVVVLVACGVGVDMLHEALPGDLIWVLLEDGGELVAMSLALYVALSLRFALERNAAPAGEHIGAAGQMIGQRVTA
ncbi:hypothetical protein C7446_1461 [Kushneria sinocarnis]|uniref:Uncharacterized protein n=1 Tax=Kushneria sinocarnis TaxID=595502 RepID=A0A420WX38_9GAMM|nr:hypothetical protein [Kushneria sinocarnis]RKR04257.1 hypothetical protein C7446_1461 [Kushneria sinocarnis]